MFVGMTDCVLLPHDSQTTQFFNRRIYRDHSTENIKSYITMKFTYLFYKSLIKAK